MSETARNPTDQAERFEVQFSRERDRWHLAEVLNDAQGAIEHAKDIATESGIAATRVVQSRFDPDSGTFTERTIFSTGQGPVEAAPAPRDEGLGCRQGRDLYRREARAAILQAIGPELERRCVTVLELLHDYALARSVTETGNLLQASVQRHAVEAARAHAGPVAVRIKRLHAIIDEAMLSLHHLWKVPNRPVLQDGGLGALVETWGARAEGERMVFSVLAFYLRPAKKWGDKLALLGRAASLTPTAAELPYVDAIVSEILEARGGFAAVLGSEPRGAAAIQALVAIAEGAPAASPSLALDELLRAAGGIERLPEFRVALVRRARRVVEVARALSDGSVLDEIRQLNAIAQTVARAATDSPVRRLQPALEQRSSRNVVPERLGALLAETPEPWRRIDLLLELEPQIIGKTARHQLEHYLHAALHDRAAPAGFDERAEAKPAELLRRLTRWQRVVAASRLSREARDEFGQLLDGHAVRLIRERRLLESLARLHPSGWAQALALIDLVQSEHFTQGKATELARERVLACLQAEGGLAKLQDAIVGQQLSAARARALHDFLATGRVAAAE